jgi:hypothetical protein
VQTGTHDAPVILALSAIHVCIRPILDDEI